MKNLPDRLIADAIKNVHKLILQAPAAMVKTLYGIGVNPAMATAEKALVLYCSFT